MLLGKGLFRSALYEELNATVVRPLFCGVEVAGGQFVSLAMIVKTFAAECVAVTGVGAVTVLFVDFRPRALVFFLHDKTLKLCNLYAFEECLRGYYVEFARLST